jgi:hypothetical protein
MEQSPTFIHQELRFDRLITSICTDCCTYVAISADPRAIAAAEQDHICIASRRSPVAAREQALKAS